jgi:hypothetical protein
LVDALAAPFEQEDVSPPAVELAETLASADDLEALPRIGKRRFERLACGLRNLAGRSGGEALRRRGRAVPSCATRVVSPADVFGARAGGSGEISRNDHAGNPGAQARLPRRPGGARISA